MVILVLVVVVIYGLLLVPILLRAVLLRVLLLLLLLHHVGRGGLLHFLRVQFVAVVGCLFLVGVLLRAGRNFVCVLFEQECH